MANTELIFVSGKGGTGKSAVAAALSIDKARSGQTVLAVDMDSSRGLGAHLRNPDLAYAPREVQPGLFALSMDRANAFDEYLKLQLRVPQGAPTKQLAGALAVLADTSPGVREIITIGKPIYETWRGTWDVVIVDAQSLGQFQSYLLAPTTIANLVPSGNVKQQAERMETTLLDPDVTSVVLVANPAELAVRETVEARDVLLKDHLSTAPTLVMNRLLAVSGITEDQLGMLGTGPIHDAAALQVSLEAEQERWAKELPHDFALPFLRGILTPGEVAGQLADALGDLT